MLEKNRHATAVGRAGGQVSPSKYLPNVPRAVHADGGKVEDAINALPHVGQNRNGVPPEEAVASPLARMEYPYMSMTPAKSVYTYPLRIAINKAHAEAKIEDVPMGKIVTDVSAIGKSKIRNPSEGVPFIERINGVHHLRDGNHRAAAAFLRGDKSIKALVADMDEAIKASGRSAIERADGGKVAFQQGNHPDVPDVMYHGTGAGNDFSSFLMPGNKTGRKTGGNAIYLSTSPDAASTFANYGEKPRVMPLHVSAKNPFDFRNSDHIDSLQGALTKNFKSWFPGAMYGPQTAINWMRGGDFGLLENNNVRSWMKRQGHDSYFVTEGEDKPLNLAVLDPKQVKSAISNNGDFDPTNPDITKADGGPAMFQGIHPDLQGEGGAPLDLYHGTPQDKEFEAFDDAKLGARDAGFYGRGHYLSPDKGNAEEYGEDGTVIGPLHAALKNPYVWDVSDDMKSSKTLRDLQSMGIMREKNELNSWDNLQGHHVRPFMAEMQKRGHDGVIVKTGYEHHPNGISEVVAFDPKTIKHKDAEVFDPADPRIRRENGGEVTKATGGPVMGYVPMASLTVPRLAVARAPQYQQQQGGVGKFSDSLNSLMKTVEGFKKKPEADAERPVSAPSPSAASEGHPQLGMIAMPEEGYEATGMYAPFQSAIDRMIADAPGKITVASGYRTPERQEELWNEHAAKYPDPEVRDDYVARAGQSSHNYGLAADLSYADQEALKWAQENAAKYGLNFRMGHENWHIEPSNIWELRNAMTVPGYATGGRIGKAMLLTRGFTKDGKSAINALKLKGK
jgi:hypothetical protein